MPKVNRWATLAASCIVQAVFGFSEMQLSTLAGALNLGGYLALISGHVYDQLQSRHNLGPRAVLWVGCVLMMIGYGGMWLQATFLVQPSFERMLMCCLIAGNAGTWWDTSALATNVRNFPDDRGSVLGILKGFLGLSTSVYASLYWAAFAAPAPAGHASHLLPAAHKGHNGHHDLRAMYLAPAQGEPLTVTQRMTRAIRLLTEHDSTKGPLAYLGVVAIMPSLLNLIASLFINQVPSEYHEHEVATEGDSRPPDPDQPVINKSARFTAMYCLVAVLAILQATSTLAGHGQPAGSQIHEVYAMVLLALLALVLLLPVSAGPLIRQSLRYRRHRAHVAALRAHRDATDVQHSSSAVQDDLKPGDSGAGVQQEDEDEAGLQPLLAHQHEEGRMGDAELGQGTQQQCGDGDADDGASEQQHLTQLTGQPPTASQDATLLPAINLTLDQALLRVDFWLLFAVFTAGCACGLSLLNNLTTLVISLGGHKGDQVAYVSLFSVGNATGRLLFGHFSEHFLHKSSMPRPVFLVLASTVMSVCMFMLTLGTNLPALHFLALIVGLAFGGHWSVIPAIATDLFGLKFFAGIYCLLQIAPAVGALLFASYLVGRFLTNETRQTLECLGLHCFAEAWRLLSVVNILSIACGLWLLHRTKCLYSPTRPT